MVFNCFNSFFGGLLRVCWMSVGMLLASRSRDGLDLGAELAPRLPNLESRWPPDRNRGAKMAPRPLKNHKKKQTATTIKKLYKPIINKKKQLKTNSKCFQQPLNNLKNR